MPRFLLLLALLLVAPAAAFAQDWDTNADDEAAVLATVTELWDAMRAGDSSRVRALIHPEAIGYSVGIRDGAVQLYKDTPEDFITAIGTPHDEVFDERVSNDEVRLDGPFATYKADYEFWLGERRSHCGVDAFHLVETEAGWQIFVLSDTRRACE
jgi:hypothetical protein